MSKPTNQPTLRNLLDEQDNERGSKKIILTTPWAEGGINICQSAAELPSDEANIVFVQERTRLHELFVREQERTKRISLILAAILILAAASLILFAPEGRETMSYWLGAALVIFAAGAAGYKRVWGKTENMSFGADQDKH